MPQNATIGIYYFDVFNNPRPVQNPIELKGVTMLGAKRKVSAISKDIGLLTHTRQWINRSPLYAIRYFRCKDTNATRLIVIEF